MEPLSARTALVVEDDDDIRDLLVRTLERDGFAVSGAPSGSTAVELARSMEPELVTLDVNLPGMDGLEVCRQLRQHSSAYVIMISARTDEADKLAGLDAGADDYLGKPFSPRELRARVAALFRRPRAPLHEVRDLERAVEVQRGLLPVALPELPGYDVAAGFQPSRLVGGDLYDWSVNDGQLNVLLADAMGKGMGAAMIAASVRSAFRSVVSLPGLTSAFNHAAQSLTSALENSGSYVTMCGVRLDPASGRFSYVDAGHGIAAVIPDGDGPIRRLEPCGPPVGLWGDTPWESRSEALQHGDSLVLVSDGVLDVIGDLEETTATMSQVVRAAGSAQEAADTLVTLADGIHEHDDATAVVVRRRPAA